MRIQPSDINGLLDQMTDAKTALSIYLSNRDAMDEQQFLARYFELLEHDTESFFTSIVDWYSSKIVLPTLLERMEDVNEVIDSQRQAEEKAIGKELVDGCTILDVGCGPGRIPFLFHDHPKVNKVHAFDISKGMLKKAEQLKRHLGIGDQISFFRADAMNLPLLNIKNPVIATCSYGTYGGIRRRDDRIKVLANIEKNADKLVLSAYNMKNLAKAEAYYKDVVDATGKDITILISKDKDKAYILSPSSSFFSTWFTEEGLRREFEMAGLSPRIEDHGEQLIAVCDFR